MEVFRASDGAFERIEARIGEFESLEALAAELAALLSIPASNLILFLASTGEQLSEGVFERLWEAHPTSIDVRGSHTQQSGSGDAAARKEPSGSSSFDELTDVDVDVSTGTSLNGLSGAEVGGSELGTNITTQSQAQQQQRNRNDKDDESLARNRARDAKVTSKTLHPEAGATSPSDHAEPHALSGFQSLHTPTHLHQTLQLDEPVGIYCFDRSSFTSEPVDFVRGLEDSLILATPLPSRPPHARAASAAQVIAATFDENVAQLDIIISRLAVQMRALEIAEGNLKLHVGYLLRGKAPSDSVALLEEASSSSDDEDEHDTRGSQDDRTSITDKAALKAKRKLDRSQAESVGSGWAAFASTIQDELERERRLIGPEENSRSSGLGNLGRGVEQDMQIISRIQVHPCFLSHSSNTTTLSAASRPQSSTSKRRDSMEVAASPAPSAPAPSNATAPAQAHHRKMLGDYVNANKMRAVRDSCIKTYEDHVSRFASLQSKLDELQAATDEISRSVVGLTAHVAQEIEDAKIEAFSIVDEAHRLAVEEPESAWTTLQVMDANLRECVSTATLLKNDFTLQLHIHLHQISIQQSAIAGLPIEMAALEEAVMATRTSQKTGFPHLKRLRNMLYAYGAACVEVVWRKQIQDLLLQGATRVAEDVSDWIEKEKARRKTFEVQVLNLLPYDIDALKKSSERTAPRLDISAAGGGNEFQDWNMSEADTDDLLKEISTIRDDFGGSKNVEAAITDLVALQHRMQRSLQDLKKHLSMPRDPEEASPQAVVALKAEVARLQALQIDAKSESQTRQKELEAEFAGREQEQVARMSELNRALDEKAAQLEEERQSRILAERQYNDERVLRQADLQRLESLEAERSQILKGLSDARQDEESLAAKLVKLQSELDSTVSALDEARHERDEALREQAAISEKLIQDQFVEANGDRAVLEQRNLELVQQLEEVRAENVTSRNLATRDINSLNAELGLAKAQLRDAQRSKAAAEEQVTRIQSMVTTVEQERERHRRFGRDAIKAASAFHDCVTRLQAAMRSSATISGSSTMDRVEGVPASQSAMSVSKAAAGDDADDQLLESELAALEAYDLAGFSDLVTYTISLVKKWQKSCKQYRERAKGKIAFANFVKGDLALFLPTRNASARVWAAFNLSSPHNFLNPTPEIAKQTEYREWVVARIVRIDEDVARPGSNPYGLAEGLKYRILSVEEFTPPPPKIRRASSNSVERNGGANTETPGDMFLASPDAIRNEYFPGSNTTNLTVATTPRAGGSGPAVHAGSSPGMTTALRAESFSAEGAAGTSRPRPPSVASSAGSSFRGYVPSAKGACTTAVTPNSQPVIAIHANTGAGGGAGVGCLASSPLAKDKNSLMESASADHPDVQASATTRPKVSPASAGQPVVDIHSAEGPASPPPLSPHSKFPHSGGSRRPSRGVGTGAPGAALEILRKFEKS